MDATWIVRVVICVAIASIVYLVWIRRVRANPRSLGNALCDYFTRLDESVTRHEPFSPPPAFDKWAARYPSLAAPVSFVEKNDNAASSPSLISYLKSQVMPNIANWSRSDCEPLWTRMAPVMNRLLSSASTAEAPPYDCVIHVRLADLLYLRQGDFYQLLTYSWIRDALSIVCRELQHDDVSSMRVAVVSNFSHCIAAGAAPRDDPLSIRYFDALVDFLHHRLGVRHVDARTHESVTDDFDTMRAARSLIGSISSYSFMAGLASTNVFVCPSFYRNHRSVRPNMFVLPSTTPRAASYINFDETIAKLNDC